MPFPFDEYPWAKFEDLNIAYMIHRLGLIISEANAKLEELDAWKTATEQDLENWKNSTMDLIAEWEHEFMADVHQWEQDTEQDLAQWKIDTIAALDTWKATFITEYNALRVEVEHIRDVATAAAQEASQAAASASADATAISASAAQIQTNAEDISDLESQLLSQVISDNFEINGGIRASDGVSVPGETMLSSVNAFSREDYLSVKAVNNYVFYVYAWEDNTYIGSYKEAGNVFTPVSGASALTHFNFCNWPENYTFKIAAKPVNGQASSIDEKTNISFAVNALGPDGTLTNAGEAADAKVTGDSIRSGLTEIIHNYNYDTETDWVILRSGIWRKQGTDTPSRGKIFKLPAGAEKVSIRTQTEQSSVIALIKSFCPEMDAAPDYATGWERTTIPADTSIEYTIPSDAQYMYAVVTLSSGVDITPDEVKLTCLRSNEDPTYLYPYDSNTQDETGKHDRSEEIMLMLNRYGTCKLANGIYYVSGVSMPEHSSIMGEGRGTEIRLLQSVSSGAAIKLNKQCTICNLTVSGNYTDRTPGWSGDITIGTRRGAEWSGETMEQGSVDNCCFKNFAGAGIYLHDTSSATFRNLAISNCYFAGNDIGVDIRKNSEFNQISNCTFYYNYIAFRNRGGNNKASNSGFDWNKTGILIDNAEGTNNGHGSITGCSINHSNYSNTLNGRPTGDGLVISGTGRMLVTNCNFYYSKVKLSSTNGNIISSNGFGTDGAVEITSGECSMIMNCMFQRSQSSDPFPITISNNTAAKIINCFDRNGYEYIA